jgi:phospholipase/carboxylesterase
MRIADEQVLWSVPESERAGRPLLVLLHGHGMTEQIGFDLRHQLPSELVVAALRGPLSVRSGYGWFSLEADRFSLDEVRAAGGAVLDWLDRQPDHPTVGVLGFSQGSAIAAQCLRTRPSALAYVALLSGFLDPLPAAGDQQLARRRPPAFSGRGDADPLVPRILVTLTDQWLQEHTTLTRRVYPGLGHNVSAEELADLAAFLRDRLS